MIRKMTGNNLEKGILKNVRTVLFHKKDFDWLISCSSWLWLTLGRSDQFCSLLMPLMFLQILQKDT